MFISELVIIFICSSGEKMKIKNGVNRINNIVMVYSRCLCRLSLFDIRLNIG